MQATGYMLQATGTDEPGLVCTGSPGSAADQRRYTALSRGRVANLDANFGLPTGMYVGDEHLPPTPDRNPGRGIETCGVSTSPLHSTT